MLSFGVGEVLWSMFGFVLFMAWLLLWFLVAIDVFRSPDLSGVAKAVWIVVALVFPLVGVLAYLIVRGDKIHQHHLAAAKAERESIDEFVQSNAGNAGISEELLRLVELRDRGVIDGNEFTQLKHKVVG